MALMSPFDGDQAAEDVSLVFQLLEEWPAREPGSGECLEQILEVAGRQLPPSSLQACLGCAPQSPQTCMLSGLPPDKLLVWRHSCIGPEDSSVGTLHSAPVASSTGSLVQILRRAWAIWQWVHSWEMLSTMHCKPRPCTHIRSKVQILRMALAIRQYSPRLEMLRTLLPSSANETLPKGACCAVQLPGQLHLAFPEQATALLQVQARSLRSLRHSGEHGQSQGTRACLHS